MGCQHLRDLIRERLAENRTEGAHSLYMEALELARRVLEEGCTEILLEIRRAKPSMAPLHYLCGEVERRLMEGGVEAALRWLADERGKVTTSLQDVRRTFLSSFPDLRRVATLSYSSTVIECLSDMETVYVGESRPRREGVSMAQRLAGRGVDVVVVVDALLPSLVRELDAAVVGADAVTPEGIVNKVGSYPLALACRHARRPFIVVASVRKIIPFTPPVPEENVQELNLPAGIDGLNRYFETVPWNLITAVVVEGRVLTDYPAD